MRLTIRHYFDFGEDRLLVGDDLVRPEAWDALRTQTDGPFSVPTNREDWERTADEREDIRRRAEAIDAWLEDHGDPSIASYGVGGATLELWLYRLSPERELIVTDYAPETVERLAGIFPEVEVIRHDVFADHPLGAGIHMFHRIDTEFTNAQWRKIFEAFRGRELLLVATEVIDVRRAWQELKGRRHARRTTKAGLIRNRAAFESLWRRTHRGEPLRLHDLDAWHLVPRS